MTSTRNMPKYVYVIGEPDSTIVKIGVTVDLNDRLRQIQSMSPVKVAVLWATPGSNALERALHQHFATHRSHGEWFSFDGDPVTQIKTAVEGVLSGDLPAHPIETETHQTARDETEASLHRREATILRELRQHFPQMWFSITQAANQLSYMDTSMREALDELVEAGKLVAGPERPLFWRERHYALMTGLRV